MFLYKALKHRDEEEDIQVHTLWLSVIGQALGWDLLMQMSHHTANCFNSI